MVSKRTKSRRRRLRRGGYSKKEYELIGQSALEDDIDALEVGQYILILFIFFSIVGIIEGLFMKDKDKDDNKNDGIPRLAVILFSFLCLIIFIGSYFLTRRNLNRVKSSKHTKSRIYRAGIDKVERDKRALADAKKYKAAYSDKQGRNFTLHRRKAKFSKKRKGSRKSRK